MRAKAGILVALLVLVAGIAAAQELVSVEIRTGTVLAVHGNDLVFRGPAGVRSVNVPDEFLFNIDGKELSVHQLKPGMRLTAVIKTTETPVEMTATEVRSGEIVHTQGGAVIVRKDNGELVKFTSKTIKESGAVITKGGDPIDLTTLRSGDRIQATIVSRQPPTIVTEEELRVFATTPPPSPKPVPKTVPVVKTEPAPKALPKTASDLPLIGLAGLILLAIGAGLTAFRRLI